jgi:hypothetical protein
MPTSDLETFIARWTIGDSGKERANFVLFLTELCEVLDGPQEPDGLYFSRK